MEKVLENKNSSLSRFFWLKFCLLFFLFFLSLGQSKVGAVDYNTYKPEQEELTGFAKLQSINPEVLGWINIYGTRIDYPLLQTTDNKKYLDTDAEGNYSITGSVFLDYRSNPQFNDFNTIIYGHHVPSGVIFGDIKKFANETFFEEHKYGSIYYNGSEKGLEIFGILEVDAYDREIYQPNVTGTAERNSYYQYLLSKAKYKRNVSISSDDHIVLLSTCFVDVTNGRHILLAKIVDKVPKNTFGNVNDTKKAGFSLVDLSYLEDLVNIPLWVLCLIVLVLLLLILLLLIMILYILRQEKRRQTQFVPKSEGDK